MRIISDFRDFYDSVQGTGQDRTLTYVRKPVEVKYGRTTGTPEGEPYPFPIFDTHRVHGESIHFTVKNFTVGFCGRIYPLLRVSFWHGEDDNTAHVYSVEEFDAFVDSCKFRDKQLDSYNKKKDKWKHGREYWPFTFRRENLAQYFTEANAKRDAFKSYFEKYSCPQFLGEEQHRQWRSVEAEVVYNGCLTPVEFYRIIEPFTAFQEISMWLGNQAEPRKPIPKIDDETMAEIKGFDRKTSFRTPPKKKK